MTDPSPQAGAADENIPAPTFFDPSFERLPAAVGGDAAAAGPVLLLFDPAADREWVADAAVALATGWHAAGRRTVLADLCLDDPFLSERIGMPNQEGVVDIFLYGASLARSARAVPGRGFYLISAGTYTPEPEAVLTNPRWEKIVAGFRDATAALLLFVPTDAPGLASVARFAPEAILLGGDGGAPLPPGLAPPPRVRAWLAPPRRGESAAAPATAPRPAAPADRFPEPEPVAPWSAAAAAARASEAPAPSAAPAQPPVPPDLPVPEADWGEPEPAPKRRVSPLLLVLLLLALVAAALFLLPRYVAGFPDVPAMLFGGGEADEATTVRAPEPVRPRAAGPAEPAGTPLPFSVQVSNYQTWEDASRFAADVARRFPEAQFFVVPEEQQGMTWWRVMAGMAGDTAQVLGLRDRLLAEEVIDEDVVGGTWDLIQARPLAFALGEFASADEARARADSLTERAIPAYVAPVPYSDGTERWAVYAGAYRDSAATAPLRRSLEAAGQPTELVERTGRPPAAPK